MKKFLFLAMLALGGLLLNVTDAAAQQIKNGTACTYAVDVFIAPIGTCSYVGAFYTITAGPGVLTPVPLPPGFYVIGYRGYDVTTSPSCGAFKVGQSCFGLPSTYSFSCTCSGTATFFPTTLGDLRIN
ncbi:MAG: hypothetical protein ACFB10_06285 [Salibacteraceae bacterium]